MYKSFVLAQLMVCRGAGECRRGQLAIPQRPHDKVGGQDPGAISQPKGYSSLAGGAYTCLVVQANAGEGSSPSLSGRVKRLEGKIPELQAKLRKHMKHTPGQGGSSTDSLPSRVEALEEAVDTLLEAQVCLQK